MPKRDLGTRLLPWLVVAGALIYFFAHDLNWHEVRRDFLHLHYGPAALAILAILLTYLLRSLRWRTLLSHIGSTSFRNLFSATVIGFSSIFIFGRLGEVVRPVMLSLRARIKPSATFATILIERIFDWVAVTIIFAIDMIFMDPAKMSLIATRTFDRIRMVGIGMLALATWSVVGLLAFRFGARGAIDWVGRHTQWAPTGLRVVMLNVLEHLAEGLYVLHDARSLLVTAGYTGLIWLTVVFSFAMVGQAFGLHFGAPQVIFVLGFSLIGSIVPTPGGSAGAFHTTTMYGLVLLGLGQNRAAGVAIAMHFAAFGSALIFGIYFFVRDGISFRALRRMISEEIDDVSILEGRTMILTEPEPMGTRR